MSDRRNTNAKLAMTVAASIAASLMFFAPRLWLMRHYVPGSFQWDRAHTYLLQCVDPFRRDIEPAMTWRILPPLVCHVLHLPGRLPLVLPWLGAIVATTYVAVLFRRRCDDWRFILGGTLLFATTSAVLVPTGWLGLNDAWIWLGLLTVAFARRGWAVAIACLLCPWIDERFIIGFPLAWLVRQADAGRIWNWKDALLAGWLVPYAMIRVWLTHRHPELGGISNHYVSGQLAAFLTLAPLAPLGWWMGLRAGWLAVGYSTFQTTLAGRWVLFVATAATAVVALLLASDMSRSIAILTPAMCLGCFLALRQDTSRTPAAVLALGVINLLIPAAHITFTKIDPINVLPVELVRLWRGV